jgi:ATP-dependent helicase/nuclease subunit B
MLSKAKEYAQVYKIVMDLLDKMVGLLGDEKVTIREYLDVFEAGIEDVKIGVIPMTIDQLVVGDIERTRLNDIKVLFFMGANENVIPKSKSSGGIISELDRELLADKGVELSPNSKQALFIEQFYLYMNLTKASDKLVITFSKIDGEGKTINAASNIIPSNILASLTGASVSFSPQISNVGQSISFANLDKSSLTTLTNVCLIIGLAAL